MFCHSTDVNSVDNCRLPIPMLRAEVRVMQTMLCGMYTKDQCDHMEDGFDGVEGGRVRTWSGIPFQRLEFQAIGDGEAREI